jgi:multisubunit Na+/H+ antiporter MnhF subunit
VSIILLERQEMMDLVYVVVIVGFFAATVGLLRFCANLLSGGGRP